MLLINSIMHTITKWCVDLWLNLASFFVIIMHLTLSLCYHVNLHDVRFCAGCGVTLINMIQKTVNVYCYTHVI